MRLIDAEALLEQIPVVENWDKEVSLLGVTADFICMICDAPTIEAKPIVHAHCEKHLEYQDDHFACWSYSCSNCNELLYSSLEHSKYCLNCGAQMDESISCSHEDDNNTQKVSVVGVEIPVLSMEDVCRIEKEMEEAGVKTLKIENPFLKEENNED